MTPSHAAQLITAAAIYGAAAGVALGLVAVAIHRHITKERTT